MNALTQDQIDLLTPEQYARLLANGDVDLIDDDTFSEAIHIHHLIAEVFK